MVVVHIHQNNNNNNNNNNNFDNNKNYVYGDIPIYSNFCLVILFGITFGQYFFIHKKEKSMNNIFASRNRS